MPVSLVRCHVLGYWGNVVDSMHVRMEMELASLGDPRRSGTRSVVLDVISLYISTGHRDHRCVSVYCVWCLTAFKVLLQHCFLGQCAVI